MFIRVVLVAAVVVAEDQNAEDIIGVRKTEREEERRGLLFGVRLGLCTSSDLFSCY